MKYKVSLSMVCRKTYIHLLYFKQTKILKKAHKANTYQFFKMMVRSKKRVKSVNIF